MALIVQDPTNPTETANSYADLAEIRAIADSMAIDLPADDAEAEKAIIKGTQYINSLEKRVDGKRVLASQSTIYPRTDATQNCEDLAEDVIPYAIKQACVVAANFYGAGKDMFGGADDGRQVASEKLGPMEKSYFQNGATASSIKSEQIDSIMAQFACGVMGGNNFAVSRA